MNPKLLRHSSGFRRCPTLSGAFLDCLFSSFFFKFSWCFNEKRKKEAWTFAPKFRGSARFRVLAGHTSSYKIKVLLTFKTTTTHTHTHTLVLSCSSFAVQHKNVWEFGRRIVGESIVGESTFINRIFMLPLVLTSLIYSRCSLTQ